MYYYAHLNTSNLVDSVHVFDTPITEDGYIEITEEQYNLPIICYRYFPNENYFEEWFWSATTDDVRYPDTIDMVTTIIDDIKTGLENKADENHSHDGYASSNDLQVLSDIVDTKADSNHNHSGYADVNHSHSEYATQASVDELDAEIGGKANAVHSHTEYALSTHEHNYAEVGHNHNSSYASISHSHTNYVTNTDFDALESVVEGKANVSHVHSNYAETIHNHDSEYSPVEHDHDENYSAIGHSHSNYATVTSVNELSSVVSGKANASHNHNDTYYTETEIDTKLSTKSDSSHNHTGVYDLNGAAANALSSANTYTDEAIEAVNETVATKANTSTLTSHTGNTTVHITATERANWNAAKTHADSTHAPTTNATQIVSGLMSSDDKIKLDGVADGANNYVLPSAGTNLGGVKSGGDVTISGGLITINDNSHNHVISNVDGLQSALDGKASSGHSHDGVYYTETEVDTLLNGKANTSHTHTIANIANLQTTLDGKATTSHGTHVTYSTTAPVMDGSASVGTASTVARSDHKHPTDTSRAAQTDLNSHTSNTSNPHGVTLSQLGITATATELNALDGITATVTELNYVDGVTSNIQTQLNGKAASGHTHNYAGSSSAGGAATSANKLNTNAGSATQPVYFANGVPVACTYTLGKSVPSNAVFTDTTYGAVTTSANGLMIASDKSKLDGMVLATVSEVETYLGI